MSWGTSSEVMRLAVSVLTNSGATGSPVTVVVVNDRGLMNDIPDGILAALARDIAPVPTRYPNSPGWSPLEAPRRLRGERQARGRTAGPRRPCYRKAR